MKKMFFVALLTIVSMHSEAKLPVTGTGLLKKAGSIDLKKAQGILGAFVTFDSVAVEGENESDIEYLSGYVRTDIPGYPLGKIRVLMLDRLAMAAGADPEKDELSEEEYFEIINGLTVQTITQSWWKSSGYRSLYIHMDGTGNFGWWIPNRASENILMLEDEPVFGLFCLNPIAKPKSDEVTDGGTPDEMVVNTPVQRRASRNSGGINTTTGTTGTGTNNSTATATNTVTVYVENPQSQPAAAPVVVERKRSGLLEFLGGVVVGYGGNELLNNNRYRRDFRDYGGRFSSGRSSGFSGGSRYGWRPSRGGFNHQSSGFRPRHTTHTPSVRRYNTSSLSGIVPRNGR